MTERPNNGKSQRYYRWAIVVSLQFVCAAQSTMVQYRPLDYVRQRRIVDLAFSKTNDGNTPGGFTMVLRNLPSFSPPLQIMFACRTDSPGSVEQARALVRLEDVFQRHSKAGPPSDELLAREMKVVKTSRHISVEACKSLVANFWSALIESAEPLKTRALENRVQLDGTEYHIEYQDGLSRMVLNFWGSDQESPRPNELPIIQWMNRVQAER